MPYILQIKRRNITVAGFINTLLVATFQAGFGEHVRDNEGLVVVMMGTSLTAGWRFTPAHYQELVLPVYFDFIEAIAAINGSTGSGFERNLSIFAALRALYREHLAGGPIAAAIVPVAAVIVPVAVAGVCVLPRFSFLPARSATLRLISEAKRSELLLFAGAESEGNATIGTLE